MRDSVERHREPSASPLGVVEWLHPGDRERVGRVIEQMASIGATRLRTGVSWADYHSPGGAEWYAWLLPELARHVELLPCFHYTPPSLGVVGKSSAPPRRPKDYADFLDVMITAFGEHFEWVELWNEPNNLLDWDWRLDPDWRIFSEMVGGAAYWMHQRGKKVLLGGNCPTDLNWLRHVAPQGVLDHVDAVGLHAFPATWSIDWAGWPAEIGQLRDCLEELGKPRPIWVTEAGVSTWNHDELHQARELELALGSDAERLYWYALEDLAPERETQQGFHVDERHYHMGLFRRDGSSKLAASCLMKGGPAQLEKVTAIAFTHARSAVPRIVVTGGAGFLGSNLVDALAARGHDVLVVDTLARERVVENLEWLLHRHRHRIGVEIADVRDAFGMRSLLTGAQGVVHLAAQVAVTTSVTDPVADFEINARGTLNVLEAARAVAPDAPLVFASTNKVYGEVTRHEDMVKARSRYRPRDRALDRGLDETTPLSFHSPYGCSKGVADQYVLDYARVFGLRASVLRMSCLYGPRQFGNEDQGWVAHFLISALGGKPVTIFGDGHQVRDLLYVDDAVAAYLELLQGGEETTGRAFNLGGGPANTLSLRELLALIPQLTGVEPEVAYAPWRPGDQAWYVSDTTALTRATGWAPTVDTGEGLRRLAAWLRTIVPTTTRAKHEVFA